MPDSPGAASRDTVRAAEVDIRTHKDSPGEHTNSGQADPAGTAMPATILVVDDNAINRQLAADILGSRGFAVLQASDAVSAMDLIERHRPDAVLMDVQIPGMNGLEAIAAIRRHADPIVAAAPIAAMTASAMPGDKERCIDAGADLYMPRPVHLQSLLDQVAYLVKLRPRA